MSETASLMLVVGEPFTEDKKEPILRRISNEFKSWNEHLSGCKLDQELCRLVLQEKNLKGKSELFYQSDKLLITILYNPLLRCLKKYLKKFMETKSSYRHLIYSGHAVLGCGSWFLRDGIFTFEDFMKVIKEATVPDFEPFYISTFAEGKWSQDELVKLTSMSIRLNPEKIEPTEECPELKTFLEFMSSLGSSASVDETFKNDLPFPSQPLSPCLSTCRTNSNLFCVGDFSLQINGGLDVWNFIPNLSRVDMLILTCLSPKHLELLRYYLEKKILNSATSPNLGAVFFNGPNKLSKSKENRRSDQLLVNLFEEGRWIIDKLNQLEISVQPCTISNSSSTFPEPVTLYHKVGLGTLKMYVLTPISDGQDLKDLLKWWNDSTASGSRIVPYNQTAVSFILIWKPFSEKDKIVRMLFTGAAPQSSIFEGLNRLKNVPLFSNFHVNELKEFQLEVPPKASGNKLAKTKPASAKPAMSTRANTSVTCAVPASKVESVKANSSMSQVSASKLESTKISSLVAKKEDQTKAATHQVSSKAEDSAKTKTSVQNASMTKATPNQVSSKAGDSAKTKTSVQNVSISKKEDLIKTSTPLQISSKSENLVKTKTPTQTAKSEPTKHNASLTGAVKTNAGKANTSGVSLVKTETKKDGGTTKVTKDAAKPKTSTATVQKKDKDAAPNSKKPIKKEEKSEGNKKQQSQSSASAGKASAPKPKPIQLANIEMPCIEDIQSVPQSSPIPQTDRNAQNVAESDKSMVFTLEQAEVGNVLEEEKEERSIDHILDQLTDINDKVESNELETKIKEDVLQEIVECGEEVVEERVLPQEMGVVSEENPVMFKETEIEQNSITEVREPASVAEIHEPKHEKESDKEHEFVNEEKLGHEEYEEEKERYAHINEEEAQKEFEQEYETPSLVEKHQEKKTHSELEPVKSEETANEEELEQGIENEPRHEEFEQRNEEVPVGEQIEQLGEPNKVNEEEFKQRNEVEPVCEELEHVNEMTRSDEEIVTEASQELSHGDGSVSDIKSGFSDTEEKETEPISEPISDEPEYNNEELEAKSQGLEATSQEDLEAESQESLEAVSQEGLEAISREGFETAPQESLETAYQESIESTIQEGLEKASQESLKATSKEDLETASQEGLEATSPEDLEATSPEDLEATSQEALEATSQEDLEVASQEGLEATSQEGLEATSQEGLVSTSQEGLEATSQEGLEAAFQEEFEVVSQDEIEAAAQEILEDSETAPQKELEVESQEGGSHEDPEENLIISHDENIMAEPKSELSPDEEKEFAEEKPVHDSEEEFGHDDDQATESEEFEHDDDHAIKSEEFGYDDDHATKSEEFGHDDDHATKSEEFGHDDDHATKSEEFGHDDDHATKSEEFGHDDDQATKSKEFGHDDDHATKLEEFGHDDDHDTKSEEFGHDDDQATKSEEFGYDDDHATKSEEYGHDDDQVTKSGEFRHDDDHATKSEEFGHDDDQATKSEEFGHDDDHATKSEEFGHDDDQATKSEEFGHDDDQATESEEFGHDDDHATKSEEFGHDDDQATESEEFEGKTDDIESGIPGEMEMFELERNKEKKNFEDIPFDEEVQDIKDTPSVEENKECEETEKCIDIPLDEEITEGRDIPLQVKTDFVDIPFDEEKIKCESEKTKECRDIPFDEENVDVHHEDSSVHREKSSTLSDEGKACDSDSNDGESEMLADEENVWDPTSYKFPEMSSNKGAEVKCYNQLDDEYPAMLRFEPENDIPDESSKELEEESASDEDGSATDSSYNYYPTKMISFAEADRRLTEKREKDEGEDSTTRFDSKEEGKNPWDVEDGEINSIEIVRAASAEDGKQPTSSSLKELLAMMNGNKKWHLEQSNKDFGFEGVEPRTTEPRDTSDLNVEEMNPRFESSQGLDNQMCNEEDVYSIDQIRHSQIDAPIEFETEKFQLGLIKKEYGVSNLAAFCADDEIASADRYELLDPTFPKDLPLRQMVDSKLGTTSFGTEFENDVETRANEFECQQDEKYDSEKSAEELNSPLLDMADSTNANNAVNSTRWQNYDELNHQKDYPSFVHLSVQGSASNDQENIESEDEIDDLEPIMEEEEFPGSKSNLSEEVGSGAKLWMPNEVDNKTNGFGKFSDEFNIANNVEGQKHSADNINFNDFCKVSKTEDITEPIYNDNIENLNATGQGQQADVGQELIIDPLADWGEPMGLPSPDPIRKKSGGKKDANHSLTSPNSSATTSSSAAATNKVPELTLAAPVSKKTDSKKAETKKAPATSKSSGAAAASSKDPADNRKDAAKQNPGSGQQKTKVKDGTDGKKNELAKSVPAEAIVPIYTDVTCIYDNEDTTNSLYNVELFKKVRSRCYILSGAEPNLNALNQLIEAKQSWQTDADNITTIAPTSDWAELNDWVVSNSDLLTNLKINVEKDRHFNLGYGLSFNLI